jgi:branched-chain amino acid transport system ATP-binding protein
VISRIYPESAGQLFFEGVDLGKTPPHKIASLGIARTFQNIELFEHATVLQNLLIGHHRLNRTGFWSNLLFLNSTRQEEHVSRLRIEEVIDFLGLQKYRDSFVSGLPYGIRKVVELGRALSMDPKLLLLDEPSSGLNPEETEEMAFWIKDLVNDLGITVLMVEHDMSLVSRVSSRVVAMNQGQVIAIGTSAQVQSHPDVIKAYIGAEDEDAND